jgi:hypothetical protein
MGWVLRLVESGIDGPPRSVEVMKINRPCDLGDLADLGLTHAQGRELLARVQLSRRKAGIMRPGGRRAGAAERRAR